MTYIDEMYMCSCVISSYLNNMSVFDRYVTFVSILGVESNKDMHDISMYWSNIPINDLVLKNKNTVIAISDIHEWQYDKLNTSYAQLDIYEQTGTESLINQNSLSIKFDVENTP